MSMIEVTKNNWLNKNYNEIIEKNGLMRMVV